MSKRHEVIGIKQAIQLEWMQKTAHLLLAGLDAKAIRQELHALLSERHNDAERSVRTRTFAVNSLMKIWVVPEPELIRFRDASLMFLREHPSLSLAVHWGMISAVYPFWFNVARQTGRLLALQNQVTQMQIISRIKERYGDRTTVGRAGQRVIRSFVAWGVIKDSDAKGCYEKWIPVNLMEIDLAILMLESALHATPEAKGALGLLLNNPAYFPFQLPAMTSDFVSQRSSRIDVVRYGVDDDLLRLSNKAGGIDQATIRSEIQGADDSRSPRRPRR